MPRGLAIGDEDLESPAPVGGVRSNNYGLTEGGGKGSKRCGVVFDKDVDAKVLSYL